MNLSSTRQDSDGVNYDPYSTLRHYDTMERRMNEEEKLEVGRYIAQAFHDLSKGFFDTARCLDGAMAMRMIGPAIFHRPYRNENSSKVRKERNIRKELLKKRKWSQLIKRCNKEQDKLDAKRKRQRERKDQQNGEDPLLATSILRQKDS